MIAPDTLLTHLRPPAESLARNRLVAPLNMNHHSAEPMNTPETRSSAAYPASALPGSQAGEDRREGEDGRGVRERQREGRGVGAPESSLTSCRRVLCRRRHKGLHAEEHEENATQETEPRLGVHQQVRDEGQPQRCECPVGRVGGGCPETRDEAGGAALRQRPADAQYPDRSDGRGDGKADTRAFQEQAHTRNSFWPRHARGYTVRQKGRSYGRRC